jgi:hypothetical protein
LFNNGRLLIIKSRYPGKEMKNDFVKKLSIGGGIILLSVIIATVAYFYFSGDLAAQAKQIVSDRNASQQQDDALSSLAGLKADSATAEHYNVAMNQLLPGQYGLAGFNGWLSAIGKNYNLTVDTTFQGTAIPAAAPTPGSIMFILEAKGPEGSMAPFLKSVASTTPGYIVSFSSLNFTNDGTQESLTAQGTLYFD